MTETVPARYFRRARAALYVREVWGIPCSTRWLAKLRTKSINTVFDQVAHDKGALRAPIAEETGPNFTKHPELFASDKFHPLDAGYAVWFPVLNHSFEQIIAN